MGKAGTTLGPRATCCSFHATGSARETSSCRSGPRPVRKRGAKPCPNRSGDRSRRFLPDPMTSGARARRPSKTRCRRPVRWSRSSGSAATRRRSLAIVGTALRSAPRHSSAWSWPPSRVSSLSSPAPPQSRWRTNARRHSRTPRLQRPILGSSQHTFSPRLAPAARRSTILHGDGPAAGFTPDRTPLVPGR